MDFRELAYIIAIAKHQSVSKAAKELYISQPTLSKFIQNVEKEIGQPLFRKIGNRFLLTYAGERYVEKARVMLLIKKELDQELSDIVKNDVGELKIAFTIMRGNYLLPCALPVFKEKYPNVRVLAFEENSDQLENMLLEGVIDIAFFTLPIRSKEILYEDISEEEIVLVMSSEHPYAGRGIAREGCKYPWIDVKGLANELFILQRQGQRTRQITDKIFRETGFEPKTILEIRNITASIQLATRGYGLVFACETYLRHISIPSPYVAFSTGNPNTSTSFVAAHRRGVYLPKYARHFIKILKELT